MGSGKEEGSVLMAREWRLEQERKLARAPGGGGGRDGDGVLKGSMGELWNKGLRELLPARSRPASPGSPLSGARFTRYRFSCLFAGSY